MNWRVVSAADVGATVRLQSLAERVFGAADRRPDWFARKLVRECIDPSVSRVAVIGDDPEDPRSWIGYVLVGRPPSRWPLARAAGTGVVAPWRGRGVATALLEASAAACAQAGATGLEIGATRDVEGFYTARGFVLERHVTTLLAFAKGRPQELPGPRPWDDASLGTFELQAYLAEAWTHSPAAERHTLQWPELRACVHVCREGRAFALHRTLIEPTFDPAIHRIFDDVLERLSAAAPVILIAIPEVSSITASLRASGWVDIQLGSNLCRPLGTAPARLESG